jgi:hypothetical protein
MTYTERKRASDPEAAKRREARSIILEAVYGPSIQHARAGGLPFGLRDSTQRADLEERRAIVRKYWRWTGWPQDTLETVLADADLWWDNI